MYTMAPEDYFKFWAEGESRRAHGRSPVLAKTARAITRPRLGRVWRSAVARRSLPVRS